MEPQITQMGADGALSAEVSDEAIRQIQQQRFRARVQRVLEVMREERIDWRGAPYITLEGKIAVRLLPTEMELT